MALICAFSCTQTAPIENDISRTPKTREEIREFLNREGIDINAHDEYGTALLHRLAFTGTSDVVAYAIKHGARINMQNFDGVTPLMLAAQAGRKDTVLTLITYGADVTLIDCDKETAVDYAEQGIMAGNQNCPEIRDILQELLEKQTAKKEL